MITITVNHYHHFPQRDEFARIHERLDKIMATQTELAALLATIATQITKAKTEVIAKIQALTDAVAAAGTVTPEVQAATEALAALAQQLDDIVPDVPPTDPT